ncbi:hypothetical protein [Falsihalocynthiibacter arcticus]|uniref:Uncharacterized protein n=1 Tax=Falsihalocynthiibacter arcticus TaxID=1579316 RepID=A0A126V0W4_9RHOB|nr:hypothetical protein [Falsihalocynthiibacter arcticus]AML51953.1 hypothetical protein RC74_12350 [Falsihalocynthiibacter arcticus]
MHQLGLVTLTFDPPLIERMNEVRARIQAEADIHAEALREQKEEQERWQREEHSFLLRNRASREAKRQGSANGAACRGVFL